jgi:hypothetical protein
MSRRRLGTRRQDAGASGLMAHEPLPLKLEATAEPLPGPYSYSYSPSAHSCRSEFKFEFGYAGSAPPGIESSLRGARHRRSYRH